MLHEFLECPTAAHFVVGGYLGSRAELPSRLSAPSRIVETPRLKVKKVGRDGRRICTREPGGFGRMSRVQRLRRERCTGVRIVQSTGLSRATVSRILTRLKLHQDQDAGADRVQLVLLTRGSKARPNASSRPPSASGPARPPITTPPNACVIALRRSASKSGIDHMLESTQKSSSADEVSMSTNLLTHYIGPNESGREIATAQ